MILNPLRYMRLRKFNQYFLSIVVTPEDSILINNALSNQAVKVFDMGIAPMVPMNLMTEVAKKTDVEDEVPYRLFYIVVRANIKIPKIIKESAIDKLRESFSFRWCYGTETDFT